MKLKVKPEDFIVEEVNTINFSNVGDYYIYILEKKSIDTISLLKIISKKFSIDTKKIGFSGLKDKYAITRQYISIPKKIENYKDNTFSLTFISQHNSPLKTGLLDGNKFILTLRDVSSNELNILKKQISLIRETGVVNYFDSQRFGSVKNGIFPARYLIKKDFENTCKYTLISQSNDFILNKKLSQNWKDFEKIKTNNLFFNQVRKEYLKTNSWKSAYKKFPAKIRELLIMSYQSYIWNECVKQYVKQQSSFFKVEYNVGDLYFPNNQISNFEFPMIGKNMSLNSNTKSIVNNILSLENISFEEIISISKSGSFLRSNPRPIIIYPNNLEILEINSDETYSKNTNNTKSIIKISFELPKGSYATVVIKSLFKK